jgi:hypothetical protein
MTRTREIDPLMGELFLAGEVVPPGAYREINGGRMVDLDKADVLPASLDGHVACYSRLKFIDFDRALNNRPGDQSL